jgi:uncharacterized RDD family membrane protein YckC
VNTGSATPRIPAGILPRAAAHLLDLALVVSLFAALHRLLELLFGPAGAWLPSAAHRVAYASLTLTVPACFAWALWESSAHRATVMQRLLHLEVVSVYGARISFPRALLRNAVKLLPWQTLLVALLFPTNLLSEPPQDRLRLGVLAAELLLGAWLAAALMTRRKQSIHDLAAGTYVVQPAALAGPPPQG